MKSKMKDTLLLIGGQNSDRSELHAVFEADYYLLEAENASQGTLLLKQNAPCIAAVLVDLPLTEEAPLRELVAASNPNTDQEIPVIFLISPSGTGRWEEYAFLLGAADVVMKPYTPLSVKRRVQILVEMYLHRWHLERLVEDQNQAIRNTYQGILDTMSSIIEHRSMESGNHILRIRGLARILLQEVARSFPSYGLTPEDIETISAATGLHDIGKIVIPDAILNKPGPLTPEEFEVMKTHTTLGSELIARLSDDVEGSYLHYAYNICLYHHERWDGRGYPKGLVEDQIPICAQVAGITDAFDALTTPRVYKPAFPYETAINMILNGECGTFSPALLECFKTAHPKLIQLAKEYTDGQNKDIGTLQFLMPDAPKTERLDTAQTSQLKYQTLLHYLNDTVIELNVDSQLYHVVHNPNPDFVRIVGARDSEKPLQELILAGVHPEDAVKMEQWQTETVKMLFEEKRRKFVFHCRVYNPTYNRFDPYEITVLRVNTNLPSQRIVIAVFHNLQPSQSAFPAATGDPTDLRAGQSLSQTDAQSEEQRVLRDYVRTRAIMRQFRDVTVEWNLVTDQLVYVDQWKERFGFDLDPNNFSKTISLLPHIHPDDLPELQRKVLPLQKQEGWDVADLRIADHKGHYSWNRIRIVSRSEGHDAPVAMVAVIYNIDDLKTDVLKMKKRAEQDNLTRLLNKASTQQTVTDYLEKREPDTLAALLLLDLDNFKLINDTYGHMYGDAVLTQVGSNLRNLFRPQDIIGRIGGDEFLVFIKDLPNEQVLHERCRLLVNTFQQQLHKLMPDLPVSVSVGGALTPRHGTVWSELFRHADDALYHAKSMGKGQYKIYDIMDTYQVLFHPITHTQIDSDQLPALNDEALVRYVFQKLYTSQDLKTTIDEVLAFVGAYFGVSRVYIFENNKDNLTCKNTFEWCNVGIVPQKEFLQCVNYQQDVPSWQGAFNENGILYSADIRELPPDLRDILEPQGIKSLLHCAIWDQGVFRGVVGFDECNASYLWTQEQISLLQFLAEVLGVFLLKEQNADNQD